MSSTGVTELERLDRRETETRGVSVRGFVILTGVMAAIYVVLATGMAGGCAGGYDAAGSPVDFDGRPTPTTPLCVTFQFHPQPYVIALLAALAMVALVAMNRASTGTEVRRIRRQAIIAIVVVGVVFTGLHSVVARPGILAQWMSDRTVQTVPFDNLVVEISPAPGPDPLQG